jgi:hypothetical protein
MGAGVGGTDAACGDLGAAGMSHGEYKLLLAGLLLPKVHPALLQAPLQQLANQQRQSRHEDVCPDACPGALSAGTRTEFGAIDPVIFCLLPYAAPVHGFSS